MLQTTNEAVPTTLHKWEPIEDLPANWHDLCRPDLHAVHRQWIAERTLIKDPAKFKVFQEKLALLWAIETGVIERLYTVDRGVTVQILEAGLQALGQFHAFQGPSISRCSGPHRRSTRCLRNGDGYRRRCPQPNFILY